MRKYLCLVVLIMSSFGWTQIPKKPKPIEFHHVISGKSIHEISVVRYYKVNEDNQNKKELTRKVSFNRKGYLSEDVSYLNGIRHGQYFNYDYGRLYEYGQYENGNRVGKWYQKWGGDSVSVRMFNKDELEWIELDRKPLIKSSPLYWD